MTEAPRNSAFSDVGDPTLAPTSSSTKCPVTEDLVRRMGSYSMINMTRWWEVAH